jgi:hypothetical protein
MHVIKALENVSVQLSSFLIPVLGRGEQSVPRSRREGPRHPLNKGLGDGGCGNLESLEKRTNSDAEI